MLDAGSGLLSLKFILLYLPSACCAVTLTAGHCFLLHVPRLRNSYNNLFSVRSHGRWPGCASFRFQRLMMFLAGLTRSDSYYSNSTRERTPLELMPGSLCRSLSYCDTHTQIKQSFFVAAASPGNVSTISETTGCRSS